MNTREKKKIIRVKERQYPNPFFDIVARIFFPPLAFWDGAKALANRLFGNSIGKIVLAEFNENHSHDLHSFFNLHKYDKKSISGTGKVAIQKYYLKTQDRHIIPILAIKKPNEDEQQDKYIINIFSNDVGKESAYTEMEDNARNTHCHVIAYNLHCRFQEKKNKFSFLTPKSKNELVNDSIAVVNHLLAQGVNPKNIIVKGASLGGAIALCVAAHFHEYKQKIKVFNRSTFSSLSQFYIEKIRLHSPIFATLASPLIKFTLGLTKWEINAASAYNKLPINYKDYCVIKTNEKLCENQLPYAASLHKDKKLKKIRRFLKAPYKKTLNLLPHDPDIYRVANTALNKINQAKKTLISNANPAGAGIRPFSFLFNASGGRVTDYFDHFFNRTHKPSREHFVNMKGNSKNSMHGIDRVSLITKNSDSEENLTYSFF